MAQSIQKAKVWLGVTYPENMMSQWQDEVSDILQGIPYAYCIHDKDEMHILKPGEEVPDNLKPELYSDGEKRSLRKIHVHWILYLKDIKQGTTTRKHATEILNLLSKPGRVCCPGTEACLNIEHAWNYLIHNTENAKNKNKHLYNENERITGNTFDIERYIVLTEGQKLEMAKEISDYIIDYRIKDTARLYKDLRTHFGEEYFEVFKANNAMFDRLCRGVFNETMRYVKALEVPKCSICGSSKIFGHYNGLTGLYWFCQECQETAYLFVTQMEEIEEEKKRSRLGSKRKIAADD